MRPHIDRAGRPRANPLLPGEHATDILTEMLVLHDAEVFNGEVVERDALKHLILRRPGPGIHDHDFARGQLAENQVVHGDLAEIEPIDRRIEADDVGPGGVHGEHAADTTERRLRFRCGRGGRGRLGSRCWRWCGGRFGSWGGSHDAVEGDAEIPQLGSRSARRGGEAERGRLSDGEAAVPGRIDHGVRRAGGETIDPFQRLEISPSKSKATVQPFVVEPAPLRAPCVSLRFVTVTSPLKPLPQLEVTTNDVSG